MMRPLPIAASIVLLIAASIAIAQQPPAAADTATSAPVVVAPAAPTTTSAPVAAAPTALTGDAARGKGLAYTCRGCHGVTGYKNAYPNYHVPKLGGQSEAYLHNALLGYRANQRKHPTMQAQAQSFSEQDIADIAAYLASIK